MFDIYDTTAVADITGDGSDDVISFVAGASNSTLTVDGVAFTINKSNLAQKFAITDVDIADGMLEIAFCDIDDTPEHDTFQLTALRSPLFDDDRLSVLKGVQFRNFVLQEVLQLLSLSTERRGKQRGRDRFPGGRHDSAARGRGRDRRDQEAHRQALWRDFPDGRARR